MSVQDHPVWYYRQKDITDPTPYEGDDEILCGEECMLCGKEFRRGEAIMEMRHQTLDHDRFLFHKECFDWKFGGDRRNKVLDVLDEFGFEVDETEEE